MEMPITFDLHIVESWLTPHFICITDTQSENVDWVQNLAIFWWRHQFLGIKPENDDMWRHVTSSCWIFTKLAEIVSFDDILFVSKYEVISII